MPARHCPLVTDGSLKWPQEALRKPLMSRPVKPCWTGPKWSPTTGDYRTTGLRDYRTTRLQDYRTTGLQDHETTGLQDTGGLLFSPFHVPSPIFHLPSP